MDAHFLSSPADSSSINPSSDVDLEAPAHSVANQAAVEELIAKANRDRSPAARKARFKTMIRAVCGEFLATAIFMFCVCGVGIQIHTEEGEKSSVPAILAPIMQGFVGVAVIYTFADISGAHFNPAVTFATWISGKTSNRKSLFYIIAQLSGVNLAMLALYSSYGTTAIFNSIRILPNTHDYSLGNVFAAEFILTFILVFIIFTVAFEDVDQQKRATMSFRSIANNRGLTVYATTPQSKTGFAPLTIGLTLGVLGAVGGSVSSACFNPARLFGPALWSNSWDHHYIYWLADFAGGATAAGVRMAFAKFGLPKDERIESTNDSHSHH
jgi:glycerol uptake facilitator-like aquaporin